jgi:rubrerythrin
MMSYYFNADEIFQIGVQIERNGKAFYEAAAERAAEPAVQSLCRELATWESKHVELFETLRGNLPPEAREGSAFDPNSEEGSYLKATADSHVFLKNRDPAALASDRASAVDLLDIAITFEKDSVVFYSAMKNAVARHLGSEKIDALIEEELRHIAILSRERAQLTR